MTNTNTSTTLEAPVATKTVATLTTSDVLSVYSGKNGSCCCGCAGKHTYNPEHRELGAVRRGYKLDGNLIPLDDDEINGATITRVLNIIKKNERGDTVVGSDDNVSCVVGNRLYVVYTV